MRKEFDQIDSGKIRMLINTALGKTKADIVVTNADLVNVYSGELLAGWSVAIKGDRIAFVGEKAEHTIGPDTMVIDAAKKALVPGFIDSHIHLLGVCDIYGFLQYSMSGGTTTIISETANLVMPLGYRGVEEFLKATADQPVKIYATVASPLNLGSAALSEILVPEKLRRLLKHKRILGMGETSWPFVLENLGGIIDLHAETLNAGKLVEGHSAGSSGNNLQAYVASGISSCHEPINDEEVLDRLRLGLHVMVREGDVRRDLEVIAGIKDQPIDFRRLVFCTDVMHPEHLIEHGHMEFVVQKAIDLGFDPIVAIQMATLNAAEHFHLDNLIGGIAPGKCADMVLLPNLRRIKAEMVISNGQIIARDGKILVQPRKHVYSSSTLRSVRIPRELEPADFRIPTGGGYKPVTVRVINVIAGPITIEEQVIMTPKDGLLDVNLEKDILKVAFINRTNNEGKMFTGFVKGIGFEKGAYASSVSMGSSGITVVGSNDQDMAGAVNRVIGLQGGVVLYAEGKVIAELPMPIGGFTSDLPIEEVRQRYEDIRRSAMFLGSPLQDIYMIITALTTTVLPSLRICEAGLIDIKKRKLLGLFVSGQR